MRVLRQELLSWAVLGVVCAFGCANPDYRADACTDRSQCTPSTPACDLNTLTCVQCTASDSDACSGATPICGEGFTCRGCRADSECDSQVCGIFGSCFSASEVLYVSPDGTGSECTTAQPCALEMALTMFTPQRSAIKLFPGTYRGTITIGDNQRLEIHGDDADLTRNDEGPIISAQGLAELVVIGLRIHDAIEPDLGNGLFCVEAGGNKPSIILRRVVIDRNQTFGVYALSCNLDIEESMISNNLYGGVRMTNGSLTVSRSAISGNALTGIVADNGTFVIVGNVFFDNGRSAGSISAVTLAAAPSLMNRLEFNSFSRNRAKDGYGSAIYCNVNSFIARNNIMSDNGTPTNSEQVVGSCAHAYSIVRPGTTPPGPSNSNRDPMFRNAAAGDLRLMAGSPALGAADPASDLTGPAELDIDGDRRTSPADIGADEVP
jgi:predicted outer membrane repeat protein